jgi:uncharacterized membrane protein YeaQ/YmgE (transglycosylase-associated protein family)
LIIHWLIVLSIAVVLGWVTSLLMRRIGMGPVVCIPVALIGAVLGGILYSIYDPVSNFAFYGFALFLTILALGGSVYAYVLTGTERRV